MDTFLAPFTEFFESLGGAQTPEEAWALLLGLGTTVLIVTAAILGTVSLFYIIVEWRIYKKGYCPGIACLIPIYNSWCYFKLLYGRGWLCLIPGVNVVLALVAPFRLATVFDHGFGYGLGLFFLPGIFMPILAFGKSTYCGPNY